MLKKILSLIFLFFSVFSQEIHKERIELVFDRILLKTRSEIMGNPGQSNFDKQNFLLWDYVEDSPGKNGFSQHFASLLAFVEEHNIRRVIVYIKDPVNFPFYSPSNTQDNNSFFSYAKQLGVHTEVEVFFDESAFSGPSGPTYGPLPLNFPNLPEKMVWVQQMVMNGAPISGVSLDPEGAGGNNEYQKLINYMDEFIRKNGLSSLKLDITIGIDERNMTFANLSTFPVSTTLTSAIPSFPANPAPSWRTSDINAPLLSSVYIQAYEPDFSYVFTLSSNPTKAAESMLEAFKDLPYKPGTGSISITMGSPTVMGTGTKFSTELLEDTPLSIIHNGSETFIGNIMTIINDSEITLYSASPATLGPLPFLQTEIAMKWTFPETTPSVAAGIYQMFSFENGASTPFFGSWSLNQFMDFITEYYQMGQADGIYIDETTHHPIPLPNQFVIYDFDIFRNVHPQIPP